MARSYAAVDNLTLEIGLSVTLFLGTNIDDVFVLLAFFSDRRFKPIQIVLGQYLGIFALALASIALAYGAKQITPAYIGLLGLVPFGLGLKKLWDLFESSDNKESEPLISEGTFHKSTKLLTVAGVTMANGGDNISAYAPIFATKSLEILLIYLLVFFVMTGIWCAAALFLINHEGIGDAIKRVSHYAVPLVFVSLGGYILYEAGSLTLLFPK
jgi:cadmium resistance protein CadD (predicted permease)